jgi:hypothetical protein
MLRSTQSGECFPGLLGSGCLGGSGEVTELAKQLQHPDWTFLSNHTHVLHCIFLWPGIRIRDIAAKVLITDRAVQRIVVDLERGGYLKRDRVGRQNHYRLKPGLHLRHPLEQHVKVGRLLAVLQPESAARGTTIRKLRNSAAVTARRLSVVSSRVAAKAISRLKKTPSKPRKLIAKKSV